MKNDNKSTGNVIDMTDRMSSPDFRERLKGLKVRFDLENTKVLISTSLLSIVVVVTLANNNLLSSKSMDELQSTTMGSRSVASVSNDISQAQAVENPQLIRELAQRDLSPKASLGKKPTQVEDLAFGYLEGKYAVRLQNGLLKEIEVSDAQDTKQVDDLKTFIRSEKALLPKFERIEKVVSEKEADGSSVETYQLVNDSAVAVAKVEFRLADGGRLLSVRVAQTQVAVK